MSRPLRILFMALAMLLFTTAFAEGYDDCKQSCAADRDTRNMSCPSAYDSNNAGEDRRQCMDNSEAAYKDCIKQCPAPAPASPSGERTAPGGMGGY